MPVFAILFILTACSSPFKSSWDKKKEFVDQLHFDRYALSNEFSPIWPVDRARLTQEFAPPKNPSHDGIDLSAKRKTPILSVDQGFVVYAGSGFNGYGNMIILQHTSVWSSLYAHMSDLKVRSGQVIKKGEVIGLMGSTGRSTGVHLHFELLENKIPVNPLDFLQKSLPQLSKNP